MKEYKYIVDTNIFLRFLCGDGGKMVKECTAFIRALSDGKFIALVPDIVIAEIMWVLQSVYKYSKTDAVELLESLLAIENIETSVPTDVHNAVTIYSQNKLKFGDALIASISNTDGVKLVSYDKEFDKLDTDIERVEPVDALN